MSALQAKTSRRRWDADEIIIHIRDLENLSPRRCQQMNPSLYGAACRSFGGWKQAVECSGICYEEQLKRRQPGYWDESKIIQEIRVLDQMNSNFVRKYRKCLYSAAVRQFGSWETAVNSSGFDYETVRKDWISVDRDNIRYMPRSQNFQRQAG